MEHQSVNLLQAFSHINILLGTGIKLVLRDSNGAAVATATNITNDVSWVSSVWVWLQPLLTGFIGALGGLFVLQQAKLRYNRRKLELKEEPITENTVNIRVCNTGIFPLKDVYVYVSVNHGHKDVMKGEDYPRPLGQGTRRRRTFVTPDSKVQVTDDRIIWSLEVDGSHPVKMDIHPGESQAASFLVIETTLLEIPSEQGFTFNKLKDGKSIDEAENYAACRVLLAVKPYDIIVKVVSSESLPAFWKVSVCPNDGAFPVKVVKKLISCKFTKLLNDVLKNLNSREITKLQKEFLEHWKSSLIT